MTSLNNYSKWDHIQLSSDDDEDCHPNIEKYTWRRLRKQQREQKREEEDKDAERIQAQIKSLEEKIAGLKKHAPSAMVQATISRHEGEMKQLKEYLDKQAKLRKLTPEDLCKDSFDHTKVNKNADLEHTTPPQLQKKLEEGNEVDPDEFGKWHEKHEALLKKYAELTDVEASRDMILANPHLMDSNATGWLLLRALELEMGGDSDGMREVVRQNQLLQYPMDLAKLSTGLSPLDAAKSFFARISGASQRAVFEQDVESFALKIKERAVQKRKEQMGRGGQSGPELPRVREGDDEYQVLSKAERMGPGGLDPLEVLETLPPAMKEAFMSHDIPALHKVLATMEYEEAKYHMDRCKKSGLWVGSGDDDEEEEGAGEAPEGGGGGGAPEDGAPTLPEASSTTPATTES